MKVFIGILIFLAAVIIITLIRAAFWKAEEKSYDPLDGEKTDVEKYRRDLSDAIKFRTISNVDPEAVDWNEFQKYHAFFKERFPHIFETMKCEEVSLASLLLTWEGEDPSLEPIALLGHQDVVPVTDATETDWTHPAFDGVDDGEFIWGRGALDMKNHLIGVLESCESLIAEGFKPVRTVYICLGHDEEVVAAPTSGAGAMADLLRQRGVKLDSVLDEGGAVLNLDIKNIINKRLAGVGIAEKGYADFEISVSAKGGHSSQPPKHTAVGELAEIIKDIEGHPFKAKMPDFVYELFVKIGKNASYPARIVTCNLWLLKPIVTKIMAGIPAGASLIRTTTAVTMASGSPAANVLPQKASVTANFRLMPGTTIKDVETHIRKCVRNKNIEVKYLKGKEASAISPTDSRSFKILNELCMRTDSGNIVAPYLVMGGTDSYHYEAVCDNIYRFAPFTVDAALLLTTHGTNERIPIACLEDALKFFKRYIRMMSAK